MKKYLLPALAGYFLLAACTANEAVPTEQIATLEPIVSMTPRFTATPVPTKTPIPTYTYTPSITPIPPSPTLSPMPSPTPPQVGIVNSLQSVRVREGPGTTFSEIDALVPGTGVTIIQQSADGKWLNIQYEQDGFQKQGWMSADLVRLEPTPTTFPSLTPSPDLTKLFLGTPLPTALLGGGTVTPTPPRSIISPTPRTIFAISDTPTGAATDAATGRVTLIPGVPTVGIDMNSIDLTATALSLGLVIPTPTLLGAPTQTAASGVVVTAPPISGTGQVQEKVNVFALCDNASLGIRAPTNLASGSTIIVWWAWYAKEEGQIEDHISASTYDVKVDGKALARINDYRTRISKPANDYVVYWYVPFAEPLSSGEHRITYRVTWSRTVSDGYESFGPGTNNAVEEGSCTFRVQ